MGETVEECIEENTFSRSDVLKDILWGYNPKNSILSEILIAEDFTMAWQGRSISVEVPRKMVADTDGENGTRLSLALAYGLTYLIFIHDPDYFEISTKATFPGILKNFNPESDYNHLYNLQLTEVIKYCYEFCNKPLFLTYDICHIQGT